MTSIYQNALGTDFQRLHPQIQRRFSLASCDHSATVGRGVMDRIWHGSPITLPFLLVGTRRHILFPDTGTNIPFTVENYAYRDPAGREVITWIRTFHFPTRTRRFDAYMTYSPTRRRIIDYLGTHQHLAVDLSLSVDPRGGLRIRSGQQRFYEGLLGFRFPALLTGIADVCEWYDDSASCFRIEVDVHHPPRHLFGYRGSFQVEWHKRSDQSPPTHILPKRIERRE